MQQAIDQFRINLENVRSLGGLRRAIASQTTEALDLSDILRAQLVMVVSALDHFVHELARLGMLEICMGSRSPSAGYLRFSLSLDTVRQWMTNPSATQWFEAAVRDQLGFRSFQHPDKIADGVRLFSDVTLWDQVAPRLQMTPRDVKAQLSLIVDRRNQIAHEADLDPAGYGRRWPIDEQLVDDAIGFIERLAQAIYDVTV